jgi:hypothetical protein
MAARLAGTCSLTRHRAKRRACFAKIARFVNSKGASLAQHFLPSCGLARQENLPDETARQKRRGLKQVENAQPAGR